MKEQHLFYAPEIALTGTLPADESAHAVRVLRMRTGDSLWAMDGLGRFYDAEIPEASPRACVVEVTDSRPERPTHRGSIRLAVAPTKNADRMEWLAEKVTETGIDALHFVLCRNSERKVLKDERINRIVISAAKQSHKATLPQVESLCPLMQFLKDEANRPGQKLIAHCLDMGEGDDATASAAPHLADIIEADADTVVLIGPEGDFAPDEVAEALRLGWQAISLGPCRLRTETAALAATTLMAAGKRL